MYDVIIVGGGPAGSTCARTLVKAGAKVAILDRAEFPRVKLCAGWLSPSFWDVIGRTPNEYPGGLWEWHACHVHYRGKQYTLPGHGWFIRRFELDEWLLRESAAELHLGANVKDMTHDGDQWRVGELTAKYLVGAGGTHCPVARMFDVPRPRRAVGVQELELQTDERAVQQTRIGGDGEPELVLLDGLSGYGWNVPKSDWLNIGCGTLDATAVRDAWQTTHALLSESGHVPVEAEAQLAHMKGHSYFLFDPVHLGHCVQGNALLVGDSLGLAHPLTAEGIVPAVTSGRLAAEAILARDPASYREALRTNALLGDYRRTHRVVEAARAMKRSKPSNGSGNGSGSGTGSGSGNGAGKGQSTLDALAARGFAWMFSGARLPAPKVIDFVLDRMEARHHVS